MALYAFRSLQYIRFSNPRSSSETTSLNLARSHDMNRPSQFPTLPLVSWKACLTTIRYIYKLMRETIFQSIRAASLSHNVLILQLQRKT